MIRMFTGLFLLVSVFLTAAWMDVAHLGDRTLFVPPPESVSEQFMRALQTGRYLVARKQLTAELADQASKEDLKQFTRQLEQMAGKITDVKGLSAKIAGDRASAIVQIKTDRGQTNLGFDLIRENGLWAIARLKPEII